MDNPAQKSCDNVNAVVWCEAEGFRINIEYEGSDGQDWASTVHRVSGSDTGAVRDLIALEVGKHGFDLGACGIWWKLRDLMPVA